MFARRLEEFVDVIAQELEASSGPVFQHERHAPRGTDAGNRRWRERKRYAVLNLRKLRGDVAANRVILLLGFCTFVPRLFRHKEECAIRVLHTAQEAEPDDRSAALHAWCMKNDVFDFLCGDRGSLER